MTKEYIERGAVVDMLTAIENEFQQYKPFHGFEHAMYRKVCETEIAIGKMPAADVVEVKHGEWVKHDCLTNDGNGNYTVKVGEIWVCSICGRDEKYREPYCHCGAKMDLEV